jgi:hypothetical protein
MAYRGSGVSHRQVDLATDSCDYRWPRLKPGGPWSSLAPVSLLLLAPAATPLLVLRGVCRSLLRCSGSSAPRLLLLLYSFTCYSFRWIERSCSSPLLLRSLLLLRSPAGLLLVDLDRAVDIRSARLTPPLAAACRSRSSRRYPIGSLLSYPRLLQTLCSKTIDELVRRSTLALRGTPVSLRCFFLFRLSCSLLLYLFTCLYLNS